MTLPIVKAAVLSLAAAGAAGSQDFERTTATVPGTASPWLAGMPDGTALDASDSAPGQSPVKVKGIAATPGAGLVFIVTGAVSHTGGQGPGPDGGAVFRHRPGAVNGISDIAAPIDSLLGVFLGDGVAGPAPAALDFSTPGQRDQTRIVSAPGQVFFIGDGMTSAGDIQTFAVPQGTTRLYLGVMDGWGWYNNSGAFQVEILPAKPL